MRRRFGVRLGAVWLLAALVLCAAAGRSFAPGARAEAGRTLLRIQMTARPEELVEPGDVALVFTIENVSDTDAQNVYLSSADGLLSEPVGRIAAGEVQVFNRTHSVTAAVFRCKRKPASRGRSSARTQLPFRRFSLSSGTAHCALSGLSKCRTHFRSHPAP